MYGDDDTFFFIDAVLKTVEKLDPEMPYFLTGIILKQGCQVSWSLSLVRFPSHIMEEIIPLMEVSMESMLWPIFHKAMTFSLMINDYSDKCFQLCRSYVVD